MKPHSRARPFQETDRAKHSKHSKHRMNILLIGSVSHAKIRTLLAAPNAIVARHPKRAMRPWFKIRDHRATRHRQSIVQILAVTQNTPNTTKILLGTSRLHRHMVHSKVAMVHSKVAMVHSKVVTANSNSRVAMVNHKVATVNHKVATVNSNSRVVATPMIGFAAAVGTTTLPEGRNAISANNLVTRIQTQFEPHQEQAQTRLSIRMIGAVVHVETTTLREGRNAIGASSRKMRSMLGRLQIHKMQRQQHQLQS